jgi:hypothetical protein
MLNENVAYVWMGDTDMGTKQSSPTVAKGGTGTGSGNEDNVPFEHFAPRFARYLRSSSTSTTTTTTKAMAPPKKGTADLTTNAIDDDTHDAGSILPLPYDICYMIANYAHQENIIVLGGSTEGFDEDFYYTGTLSYISKDTHLILYT